MNLETILPKRERAAATLLDMQDSIKTIKMTFIKMMTVTSSLEMMIISFERDIYKI